MRKLLERLLVALDVEVDAFAICEVSSGWRLAFDPAETLSLHYGLAGSGVMVLADGRRFDLVRDTLLLLPSGIGHSFELPGGSTHEFRPGSWLPLREDGDLRIRAGTGEIGFAVACGRIQARYTGILGIFKLLGSPIVEHFEKSGSLRGPIRAVLAELAVPRLGTRVLTSALLKQCLVLLLRRQLARGDDAALWLAVFGDPQLAKVTLAMLERPAEPYTLGDLARIAGMSRSAFAERFSAALGRPPIEFLKEVRLRHAARLLETTDIPVKTVASGVGYSSRSYFSRAFKELYGVYPASFRDQAAAGGPHASPRKS